MKKPDDKVVKSILCAKLALSPRELRTVAYTQLDITVNKTGGCNAFMDDIKLL